MLNMTSGEPALKFVVQTFRMGRQAELLQRGAEREAEGPLFWVRRVAREFVVPGAGGRGCQAEDAGCAKVLGRGRA